MDFGFTAEEEAFRQEVRVFLKKELPPGWFEAGDESIETDAAWAFDRAMSRKLAQKGWLVMAWPREYGGQDASHAKQLFFKEEMAYSSSPGIDGFGTGMIGPTLIIHGTEEQKRLHLSRIARGETRWCQGFSEPGAGSDLASLQTRAVEDGDDFVINGQKVWTSGAHRADWMFILVRTDPDAPKHRGISYLMLDFKTPGITIRPLINAANAHGFNEVYFDDVRTPKTNLVGEKNRGWYVAMTTLNNERSGIAHPARARRVLELISDYARETPVNGQPLIERPLVRYKLTERAVETEVGRLLCYRVAWMQSRGLVPDHEPAMAKLFGSELGQRVALTGMEIMGLSGQLLEGSKWARLQGKIARMHLRSLGYTIEAGTSEIQRNIVATRGLGLPR